MEIERRKKMQGASIKLRRTLCEIYDLLWEPLSQVAWRHLRAPHQHCVFFSLLFVCLYWRIILRSQFAAAELSPDRHLMNTCVLGLPDSEKRV